MIKYGIIFGGSGYIGTFLKNRLIEEKYFDKIIICDIRDSYLIFGNEFNDNPLVSDKKVDVRNSINLEIENPDIENSWVFNLAAIHREPGHEYNEYFDTNISGAENVNEYLRRSEIKNLFFTSSIAPYGKSLKQSSEKSYLYPETAYGVSKALAERIHREWLHEDSSRRLIIVRPSVIFGPKDPGNVFRMIKSLRKGSFILPNGGNIIKGYGYIFGLIDSIIFTMNRKDPLIVYNYAENPLVSLKEMVEIVKDELSIKKPTLKLPVWFLSILAGFISNGYKIVGKKTDLHPVRVRKAGFPTNIKPQFLIDNGFEFKFEFRAALRHWKKVCPEDFN
ncbi:NAD-dependent epimerase/dehydratase family protein [Robertkochia solimangrovi]|uniref:NAD-dependent epimerase/dehydratase family protein n=1 Tax=Robertkochia solimangrovi TaxID=2213046 RepID=UPI001180C4A6|nr:NAD(P)-dependent oxidoreductase [Robertkochia solimangrovi]TRZ46020.1 NAD(P)-dependent oxidoreductase [Robertkochia solimangrovi]